MLGPKKEKELPVTPPATKEEAVTAVLVANAPVPAKPAMRKFAGHDHPTDSFVTVMTTGDGALNGHAYRAGEVMDVPESALDHFQRTKTGKLHTKKVKA